MIVPCHSERGGCGISTIGRSSCCPFCRYSCSRRYRVPGRDGYGHALCRSLKVEEERSIATGEGEGREPDLPRARFDTGTDVGEANARAELGRPTMPLSATDVEVAVTRRVERKADRPSAMPLLTVAIGALSCG